jgi:hypothetical protein
MMEGIQAQQYEPSSPCPEFTPFPKKCQKELNDMSPEFQIIPPFGIAINNNICYILGRKDGMKE